MTEIRSIEWAAGLFEGEGCISVMNLARTVRPSPRLILASTDKDVVESFQEALGGRGRAIATRHRERLNPNHKTSYIWTCGKRDQIAEILKLLYPYLGTRRKARTKEVFPLTKYLKEGWATHE